jgi:hypothetical protein
MLILGAMVVRDESDIVELSVRHNLALLDGIAIVDHASTDGTSEILAALVAEPLPVMVVSDPHPAFRQKAMINALARRVVSATAVDWLVVLDADEFLVAPSRAALECTLAGLPRDRHAILSWPTHVPDFDTGKPLAARLDRTRRVAAAGPTKIAVPRAVLEDASLAINAGQHGLDPSRPGVTVRPGERLPEEEIAIAHVPIRSAEQFVSKFATGWLSLVAMERKRPASSMQWRVAFDMIVAGEPLDDGTLTAFAANYGLERDAWRDAASCLAPAAPFLLAHEQRYAALARPRRPGDALRHAERLLLAPR